MKIFNWIHAHQFSGNVHSSNVSLNGDGSSGRIRRLGSPIGKGNAEKKPLLKQDVSVGQQSWEFEGILTIGTLAIGPLKTISLQDEDDHEHEKSIDGEVKQSYINDYDPENAPRDVETKCNEETDAIDEEIVHEKMAKIEKRVTLLDLFLADRLEEKIVDEAKPADDINDYGEDENVSTKKMKKTAIFYTKLGGKKAKKLLPKDDDDDHIRRPMKKMQRFVARMMKKKIHPDMEARMQKKAQGMMLNDDVPLGIDGLRANESAFLLPINQGIMV